MIKRMDVTKREEIYRPAIIEAMRAQDRSISDVSRCAGVDRAGLSDFLHGKTHLRSDVMDRLMHTLNLRIVHEVQI
jgi:predicted transcriptional regulator